MRANPSPLSHACRSPGALGGVASAEVLTASLSIDSLPAPSLAETA